MARIYKITNILNNKIYIGQTVRKLSVRWSSHLHSCFKSTRKNDRNFKLYIAIREFGKENFKIESIEELDTRDVKVLDEREKYWIRYYNSTNPEVGYNVDEGGHVISDKCRQTKIQMQTGVPLSQATKDKLRDINQKVAKRICQYTPDGEFIAEYRSIIEASRQTGTDRRTIQRQLSGESNTGTKRSKANLKFIWKLKQQE